MGRYLALKDWLLKMSGRAGVRLGLGAAFVAVGAVLCGGLAWGLTRALTPLPGWLELALLAVLLKPFFSVSALLRAGETVREALQAGDVAGARRLLG